MVEERGYDSPEIALFCGTLPLIDGHFQYSSQFRGELSDPKTNKSLTVHYQVKILKDAEED